MYEVIHHGAETTLLHNPETRTAKRVANTHLVFAIDTRSPMIIPATPNDTPTDRLRRLRDLFAFSEVTRIPEPRNFPVDLCNTSLRSEPEPLHLPVAGRRDRPYPTRPTPTLRPVSVSGRFVCGYCGDHAETLRVVCERCGRPFSVVDTVDTFSGRDPEVSIPLPGVHSEGLRAETPVNGRPDPETPEPLLAKWYRVAGQGSGLGAETTHLHAASLGRSGRSAWLAIDKGLRSTVRRQVNLVVDNVWRQHTEAGGTTETREVSGRSTRFAETTHKEGSEVESTAVDRLRDEHRKVRVGERDRRELEADCLGEVYATLAGVSVVSDPEEFRNILSTGDPDRKATRLRPDRLLAIGDIDSRRKDNLLSDRDFRSVVATTVRRFAKREVRRPETPASDMLVSDPGALRDARKAFAKVEKQGVSASTGDRFGLLSPLHFEVIHDLVTGVDPAKTCRRLGLVRRNHVDADGVETPDFRALRRLRVETVIAAKRPRPEDLHQVREMIDSGELRLPAPTPLNPAGKVHHEVLLRLREELTGKDVLHAVVDAIAEGRGLHTVPPRKFGSTETEVRVAFLLVLLASRRRSRRPRVRLIRVATPGLRPYLIPASSRLPEPGLPVAGAELPETPAPTDTTFAVAWSRRTS